MGKSDTSGNETSTAILLSLNYEAKNADVSRDGWVVETSVHIAAIQVWCAEIIFFYETFI